tara:strand:- start:222 stop:536 length:315 start_codon:yes stop_codon:yes gene_type:complete
MRIRIISIGFLLALTACGTHTNVQSRYQSERNECQEIAEDMLPQFVNERAGMSEKDVNAQLVTLFSDCMFSRGWTVATPTREVEFKADPGVGVGASVKPGRAFQ